MAWAGLTFRWESGYTQGIAGGMQGGSGGGFLAVRKASFAIDWINRKRVIDKQSKEVFSATPT